MTHSDNRDRSNHIAIIGTAGRFPGARSVTDLWRMLDAGRTGTTWLTDDALLATGATRAEISHPNYVKAGNFLEDMRCFDAGFFGFSPQEASILDPQHRHFLEVAWEALEDAGHVPESFDGRIGVFAGSGMQAYLPYNLLSNPDLVERTGLFLLRHTGNDKDFLTTRASYLLDLQGPSVAVQTACSTSLVAVHHGVNSLLAMESDMVIAGGVTIDLPDRRGYRYQEGEILSPDGRCCAFDDASQGTIFGSGAALVVMRRLEDALADGDDIRAVILASAINNDGAQKAGYLAPSVDGQAEAAAEAITLADIDPETVSYVEAHGTGTPVGDPIELAAMSQAYGAGAQGSLGIGSIKTNIGHLDTAAGAASLIKVVEAMRHGVLPASLNCTRPNRRFDFESSRFRVVMEREDWAKGPEPRRAGVNSVGVGGTNAHVIVEEAPARAATAEDDLWRLLPFSARTDAALDGTVEKWRAHLERETLPPMADVAYTLQHGRRAFGQRMAIAARGPEDLKNALAGEAPAIVARGAQGVAKPEVVFMMPGLGAQYPGAAADLLETAPAFAEAVRQCFALLPEDAPADLRAMMFEAKLDDAEAQETLKRPTYAVPANFILQFAYGRLWQSWGIEPAAMVAHSVGEYAAATLAEVMALEDALRIVTRRGQAMEAAPRGAMTVLPVPLEEARDLAGDMLDIAACNAPDITVVSGEIPAIEALEAKLAGTDREAKRIHISVAAHSRLLDGQLERFRACFEGVEFSAPKVPLVSSLSGRWATGDDFVTADYWVRHLRETVHFTQALSTILSAPGRILLEVGSSQSLTPLSGLCDAAHPAVAVIPSARQARRDEHDLAAALTAAGRLWCHGVALDWARLPGAGGQRVSLPTYAFERQVHWIEPGRPTSTEEETEAPVGITRIDGIENWFEGMEWRERPLPFAVPDRTGQWLVLAEDGGACDALVKALRKRGEQVIRVRAGAVFEQRCDSFTLRPDYAEDYAALFDAIGGVPTRVISLWGLGVANGTGESFDAAFSLARAIELSGADEDTRLVFATSGALAVTNEAPVEPLRAGLLGPVRVLPREMPGVTAQLLDFEAGMEPAEVAGRLLEEQDARAADDCVAYRGSCRLAEFRRAIPANATSDVTRLKSGGRYVITGGAGGIGRALARWLGTQWQARVTLIGRSEMPDEAEWDRIAADAPGSALAARIALARDIAAAGGALRFATADVARRDQLEAALDAAREAFGGIDGVVHAAGVLDDAPMAAKTLDDARAVLAPKIEGGRNLSELLPHGTLDFLAVFSSTSVELAPAGQSDYVAANAMLEALAQSRSDGLSIAWGIWGDTGMAARAFNGEGTAGEPGTHPLLGERQDLPNGGCSYTTHLDAETLWVLSDHRVGGAPVLPGTAYLEMLRAGFAAERHGAPVNIAEMTLLQPMAFAEGQPRQSRLTFAPIGDGNYEATIESSSGEADGWDLHCRANLTLATGEADGAPVPVEFDRRVPGGAASPKLIQFGPRWQVLDDVEIGNGIAEALAVMPSAYEADLVQWQAHPGMLDMTATLGLHLLPECGSERGLYAPVGFESVDILEALRPKVRARAWLVSHEPERFARFDARIEAEDGTPLIVIRGLDMRFVAAETLSAGAGQDAPQSLMAEMLANGIRVADAPALFDRVFSLPERRIIASSISLDAIRDRMHAEMEAQAQADVADHAAEAGEVAFSNPVEAKIAGFFGELLGVANVSPEDDFFQIGGHSLLSVRLFSKISQEFGVRLPMSTLFQTSTVAGLTGKVIEAAPQLATEAEVDERVPSAPGAIADAQPGVVKDIESTEAQREILAAILIEPEVSKAYNLPFSLTFEGDTDDEIIRQAVHEVFGRHESLRSTFSADGQMLHIAAQLDLDVGMTDWSNVPEAEARARLADLREQEANAPFDLTSGPVCRAQVVRVSKTECELLMVLHHSVCDGWSIGVLMKEILAVHAARLKGQEPVLAPAPALSDFVAAEKDWRNGPDAEAHKNYWLKRFSDHIPAMDLMTDRPRPAVKSVNGERVDVVLDPAIAAKLRRLAESEGSNLGNIVFAAFQLYLSRVIGDEDVVVGLPSSGQISFGMDAVVGHCVNFLAIRNQARGAHTFSDFLGEVRHTLMDALDHQNYPYGNFVRDLRLPRDPSRVMLVPVIFNIDNLAELASIETGTARTRFRMHPRGFEHFEIFFNLLDEPDAVRFDWSFNSDLFDRSTIEAHIARFTRLLEGLSGAPETRLAEVDRFYAARTPPPRVGPSTALGPQTIPEVFAEVVSHHADRIAVRFGDRTMTYAELDRRSGALAAALAERGIGAGDLVGISSQRCLELAVAVMGVLRSGAGYVPFDTSLPEDRLRFMAEDTGIRLLLGNCEPVRETGVEVIAFSNLPQTGEAPSLVIDGEAVAYVMYTSGTTGKPKGVILPHRSVIRLLVETHWIRLGPECRTLHSSAFAFDTSIIDIFGALLHGGELVIPKDGTLSIADLVESIEANDVTTLWLTSGLFHAVADARPQAFARVRQLVVGGDIVSPVHARKVMETCPGLEIINGYGPTENNVTTAHAITEDDLDRGTALPIGPAIRGTEVFVVDESLNPVEPGMRGELCCAGRGLALGYLNRPELTAEKFVTAPWDPDLKLYRTGDLASDPGNGVLRFFGRIDSQVKIRGFRVELGEVEAALEAHPDIHLAAATATVPEGRTDKVIAAYYVPEEGRSPQKTALTSHLRGLLPEYAQPSFLQPLLMIPLNHNGKIDRRALPKIGLEAIDAGSAEAQTEVERTLKTMWGDLLGVRDVGVEANFFELGGHSLLAVRLFERIHESWGLNLPISTLFMNSTIRELAALLDAKLSAEAEPKPFDPDEPWDTTTIISKGPKDREDDPLPLFMTGGVYGNVNNLYVLGQAIGRTAPFIGLQTRGILGHSMPQSVEEIAADHIEHIRQRQPHGPYNIAGYSAGALVAHEIACQLQAAGEEVPRLLILDSFAPGFASSFRPQVQISRMEKLGGLLHLARTMGPGFVCARAYNHLFDSVRKKSKLLQRLAPQTETTVFLRGLRDYMQDLANTYEPKTFDGPVTLFYTTPIFLWQRKAQDLDLTVGWKDVATGRVDRVHIPGDHQNMVTVGAELLASEMAPRLVLERASRVELRRAG